MRLFRTILISIVFLFVIFSGNPSLHYTSFKGINPRQTPEYIQMPSLKLLLPVEVSKIKQGEWILNEKKTAFYGEKSAHPGTPGVTVIFAHAREGYFALLPLLKKDNTIVIQTKKMMYFYEVKNKIIIDPTDVEKVLHHEEKDKNVLAVFTCYGVGDTQRIIFFAHLQSSISIDDYKKSYIGYADTVDSGKSL